MKKLTLIAATILLAFTSHAQTNPIVFTQLLSRTNTVLMTNAEFRCAAGEKLFFKSADEEKGFNADSLDTNVLSKLGYTAEQLKAMQARKDASDAAYRQEYNQQLAQIAKQKQEQQLQAEVLKQKQAAINAQARAKMEDELRHTTVTRTMITGGDAINGYQTTTYTQPAGD
jgi:hypothetical protein